MKWNWSRASHIIKTDWLKKCAAQARVASPFLEFITKMYPNWVLMNFYKRNFSQFTQTHTALNQHMITNGWGQLILWLTIPLKRFDCAVYEIEHTKRPHWVWFVRALFIIGESFVRLASNCVIKRIQNDFVHNEIVGRRWSGVCDARCNCQWNRTCEQLGRFIARKIYFLKGQVENWHSTCASRFRCRFPRSKSQPIWFHIGILNEKCLLNYVSVI